MWRHPVSIINVMNLYVLAEETAQQHCISLRVEFYLYPTVGTVLIHSVKPELTE